MKEPTIHRAPWPTPVGYGWLYFASRCDAMGWADKAEEAREMHRRSVAEGRSLRAGEVVKTVKFDEKGQGLLW